MWNVTRRPHQKPAPKHVTDDTALPAVASPNGPVNRRTRRLTDDWAVRSAHELDACHAFAEPRSDSTRTPSSPRNQNHTSGRPGSKIWLQIFINDEQLPPVHTLPQLAAIDGEGRCTHLHCQRSASRMSGSRPFQADLAVRRPFQADFPEHMSGWKA